MIIDLNPTESHPSSVATKPAPDSQPAATGLIVTAPQRRQSRGGKLRAAVRNSLQGSLIVTALAVATSAQGVDVTWNGGFEGDPTSWDNTNNWVGGDLPQSSDTAVFGSPVSSYTVDLGGGSASVDTVAINSSVSYQFLNGSLGLGSGVQVLQGSHTMDCDFDLPPTTSDWAVSSGANLEVNGVISGSSILQKSGDGTLTVNGNLIVTNPGSNGTLDIRRGTIVLNASLIETDSLLLTNSAGFLTFNGGTLITHGGTVSNGQNFVVGASGTTPAILDVQSNAPLVLNNYLVLGANTAAAGNQLLVSDGGVVANTFGILGYNTTANNNLAMVTGAGSLWTNSAPLYVGYDGSGNQLVVSNGAVVATSFSSVGVDSTASNNLAVVTGTGSLWANSGDLAVGSSGRGNQLVVTNGGTVQAANAYVGANSTGNRVTVDGGNLMVTNSGGNGTLDIRRGTNVLNAGLIQVDNLLLNNSAGFFEFNGGTLITGGGTVNNGQAFVVGAGGTTAAILNVRSNTPLTLNNGFTLGANTAAAGDQLLLTNGGMLSVTGNSFLGATWTASNNLAVVSGSGSRWISSQGLTVGDYGSENQLVVSGGGVVANATGFIGNNSGNNVAMVTGSGSLWTNNGTLHVGFGGSGNQLIVSNGSLVASSSGSVGYSSWVDNNVAMVTGTGSRWISSGGLEVGGFGSGNQLVVSNGGMVANATGSVGYSLGADNNLAVVTGAGSLWSNRVDFYLGDKGSGSQLVVSNGGTVQATNAVVGYNTSSTNNRATVDGGNLIVTNSGGVGTLDIRRGTNVLNAGLIQTDNLMLTNSAGFFEFNGGTLTARGGTVDNGQAFVVGNGSSEATYQLNGNGLHTFTDGLVISTAATLKGNGTVAGLLTVQSGGTVMPGNSVGKLVLSNSPALQGSVLMEISKTGTTLTNDQIQVLASLNYGGNLVVSNLGPDALTVGNSFPLFSASSYGGAFTGMSLPPLNSGLMWTNQLLLNGSIAVVPQVQPSLSGLVQSGTNLVFNVSGGSPGGTYTLLTSTNVALPLSSWATNSTGNFDWMGNIMLTNGINPNEAQRYFNIRVP